MLSSKELVVAFLLGVSVTRSYANTLDNDDDELTKKIKERYKTLCNSNLCRENPGKPVKEVFDTEDGYVTIELSCPKDAEQERKCRKGYHDNGDKCEDVNECGGSHRCHANAQCINTLGSYICRCNSGYHGDGSTCSDVNECGGSHGCHANAQCIITAGSYICRCNSGYQRIGRRCSATNIRLSYGRYGRVEVYYRSQWGTVCDDHWDINDGHVVCRMLGYSRATSAPQRARYGQGTGRIWLDDVNCNGHESSIFSCPHRAIGSHNCGHKEDASVVCA